PVRQIGVSATRLRTLGYRDAGLWLRETVSTDATLASPEIGALGYYWRGRILDACGDRSGALVEYDRVRSLKTPQRSERAARNAAKAQFKPFRPRKRLVEPADGGSACSGVGRVGTLSRP
ncbi:MAG: hypothetical protein O7A09_08200, partial [Proteobacteria bacterium]|nr:hypothetical protein [Pseudomonadota bacterium]